MKDGKKRFLIPLVVVLIVVSVVLLVCGIFAAVSIIDKVQAEKEFEQIDAVNVQLDDIRDSDDYWDKDVDERIEIMMEVLEDQADEGNIIADSIELDEENQLITYYYTCGMLGIEEVGDIEEDIIGASDYEHVLDDDFVSFSRASVAESEVLVLSGIDEKKNKNGFELTNWLVDQLKDDEVDVTYDGLVTLNDLTKLKGYKFVFFIMHGTHVSESDTTYLKTNEKYNVTTHQMFRDDLNSGAAALKKSKNIFPSLALLNGQYCFSPEFLTAHYSKGDLSGSIFYFACCRLMGNKKNDSEKWTEALEELSLSAFVGFHDSVSFYYAIDFGYTFFNHLADGETALQAYDSSTEKWGSDEQEYFDIKGNISSLFNTAYPLLRGDDDACLHLKCDSDGDELGLQIESTTQTLETTQAQTPTPTPTPSPTPTPTPVTDIAIDKDNFPDPEFRDYIAQNYDLDGNGYLSEAERTCVEDMDVREFVEEGGVDGYPIINFKGIEYFTELTQLTIYGDAVLEELDISMNHKLQYTEIIGSSDPKKVTMMIGQSFSIDYGGPDCGSSNTGIIIVSAAASASDSRLNKFTAISSGECLLYYEDGTQFCTVIVTGDYVVGYDPDSIVETTPTTVETTETSATEQNYDSEFADASEFLDSLLGLDRYTAEEKIKSYFGTYLTVVDDMDNDPSDSILEAYHTVSYETSIYLGDYWYSEIGLTCIDSNECVIEVNVASEYFDWSTTSEYFNYVYDQLYGMFGPYIDSYNYSTEDGVEIVWYAFSRGDGYEHFVLYGDWIGSGEYYFSYSVVNRNDGYHSN